VLAFGLVSFLGGCATQSATSQALTVGGAAAVVVGASLASDAQCFDLGPGQGGSGYCAPGPSRGGRQAGTALAVAGAGVAAAGYALAPKGLDIKLPARTKQAPSTPTTFHLVRREPLPLVPAEARPAAATPGPGGVAPPTETGAPIESAPGAP
jgi:hypothetical protein